jgi:hypothetical protein
VLPSATLDLAVLRAVPVAGEPRRVHLELVRRGRLVMPAVLALRMMGGGEKRVTIPAEAWRQAGAISIDVQVEADVKEVVLDPDHKLPLADRAGQPVQVR